MRALINIALLLAFSIGLGQNRYSEIKYYFQIDTGGNSVVLDCALLCTDSISTFINFGFNSIPQPQETEINDINGDLFVNINRYDDNNGQKP